MGFANRRQCIASVHLRKEKWKLSNEKKFEWRALRVRRHTLKIMIEIDYISHMLNNFLFHFRFIEIRAFGFRRIR